MMTGIRTTLSGRIATAAVALLLVGCQTTGDSIASNPLALLTPQETLELSPEEKQLREDAATFRNTVFGGALTFGGVTALACILSGKAEKPGDCLAPAVVGGLIGAIDGYRTAKKQEAARKQVREIDLITMEIEERNANIQEMVASARKVVAQNRERINETKLQIAQQAVAEEFLKEEQKRLQSNIHVISRTIETLKKEKATYDVLAQQLAEGGGDDVEGLRSQVESMGLQIAALEMERDALEEINQTTRIG